MKKTAILILITCFAITSFAETIPQKPDRYFSDQAGLVTEEQGKKFNETLAQFERDTSNQFVVATYPYMDTQSDAADYTQRIAKAWQVGQKGRNNGLVLFVFMKTASGHGKIYAQVGYGLEGAVPDATAFQITQKMVPYFKSKDYNAGLALGIHDFMSAAKGEYQGTGKTHAEAASHISSLALWMIVLAIVVISGLCVGGLFIWLEARRRNKDDYDLPMSMRASPPSPPPSYPSYPVAEYTRPYSPPREDADDDPPSYSSRHSSSDDSSSSYSSSSDSSSSFSSGGGSFGGGGGGSDF